MSLGIKLLRRVQPESLRSRGLSSIPRESIITTDLQKNVAGSRRSLTQIRAPRLTKTKYAESAKSASRNSSPSGSKTATRTPSPSTLVNRLASVPVRRHGPGESILVPSLIEYRRREETLRSRNKRHRALTAQLRFDRLRAAKRAPAPDWRVVLQYLLSSTPKIDPEAAHESVVVTVPPDGAAALRSDAENSLWDIRSRTGCVIQAHWGGKQEEEEEEEEEESGGGDNEGENPYLVLSGTRSAIDAAIQDIVKVSMVLKVTNRADSSEKQIAAAATSSRLLVTIGPTRMPIAFKEYTLTTSVEDIPTPEAWTRESFERYVAALTNGRLAPNLARRLYPANVSHQERVVQRLHEVFNEPAARPAVSNAAVKMALAYMAREGTRFRTDVQALFVRMEMFGLRMDAGVFDLLAESAVKARDLGGFQAALRLMIGRGFPPTLRTWVLFLKLLEAEEVKRYVLHAMDQKGLFHLPAAPRVVAQEMAEHDTDRAVLLGKDLATFLAEQDALYGPTWPSRNAVNRILEVLGRHGRFDDMAALLDRAFADPRARPDAVTLNIALTHCHAHRNFPDAVATLRRFEASSPTPARDPLPYYLLFEMAWRTRRPHTLDLVWRYAALLGTTAHLMRRRAALMLRVGRRSRFVLRSLSLLPSDAPTGAVGGMVRRAADAIVRGNTRGHLLLSDYAREHGPAAAFNLRHGTDAISVLLTWYRLEWGRMREPAAPLSDLLCEALERDARFYEDVKAGRELTIEPVVVPTRMRMVRSESGLETEMGPAQKRPSRGRDEKRGVRVEGEERRKLWRPMYPRKRGRGQDK